MGEGVGSVDAVDIARGDGNGLGEVAGIFLVMLRIHLYRRGVQHESML